MVVLGGLLCLTYTPVFTVSLGEASCGGSFCLTINANFLMDCNFLAPMDSNGAVGSGYVIASIKYSAELVSTC